MARQIIIVLTALMLSASPLSAAGTDAADMAGHMAASHVDGHGAPEANDCAGECETGCDHDCAAPCASPCLKDQAKTSHDSTGAGEPNLAASRADLFQPEFSDPPPKL